MRNIYILSFTILVNFNLFAQSPWKQLSNFAGNNRSSAVGFGFNTNGFVGCGYDNFTFKKGFFSYNINNNSWADIAGLGGANGGGLERNLAISFVINNKGYVGTGQGGAPYLKDFWEYNAADDTWTQKADFGGTARKGACGFSIGSHGYIGTGQDANGLRSDFWKFDAVNNNWSSVARIPGASRQFAVGFAISTKGYVGTGDKGTMLKDFWEYDPKLDSWTQKAPFGGTARKSAVAFSLAAEVYIGSGYDSTLNYTNDFWKFNPSVNTWTQMAACPGISRSAAVGFSVNGKGYFGTGYSDGNQLNDMWEFNPNLVSVNEISNTEKVNVKVYPNPMINYTTISIDGNSSLNNTITIFNSIGKLVSTIPMNKNCATFQRNGISSGVYFYSITNENSNTITIGKIIIND